MLKHKCTHVCSFLLRNDALWDIGIVHCEICAMVQLVLAGLFTHKISYEGANFNTNLLKVSYMGDYFNFQFQFSIFFKKISNPIW